MSLFFLLFVLRVWSLGCGWVGGLAWVERRMAEGRNEVRRGKRVSHTRASAFRDTNRDRRPRGILSLNPSSAPRKHPLHRGAPHSVSRKRESLHHCTSRTARAGYAAPSQPFCPRDASSDIRSKGKCLCRARASVDRGRRVDVFAHRFEAMVRVASEASGRLITQFRSRAAYRAGRP